MFFISFEAYLAGSSDDMNLGFAWLVILTVFLLLNCSLRGLWWLGVLLNDLHFTLLCFLCPDGSEWDWWLTPLFLGFVCWQNFWFCLVCSMPCGLFYILLLLYFPYEQFRITSYYYFIYVLIWSTVKWKSDWIGRLDRFDCELVHRQFQKYVLHWTIWE